MTFILFKSWFLDIKKAPPKLYRRSFRFLDDIWILSSPGQYNGTSCIHTATDRTTTASIVIHGGHQKSDWTVKKYLVHSFNYYFPFKQKKISWFGCVSGDFQENVLFYLCFSPDTPWNDPPYTYNKRMYWVSWYYLTECFSSNWFKYLLMSRQT